MELTQEEKNFLIEVLMQTGLNYQTSETRKVIINKLQVGQLANVPEIDKPIEGEVTNA